jgi:hypothetical protein
MSGPFEDTSLLGQQGEDVPGLVKLFRGEIPGHVGERTQRERPVLGRNTRRRPYPFEAVRKKKN